MEEKKDKIFPCPVCLMVVIIVIVAAAAVGAIFGGKSIAGKTSKLPVPKKLSFALMAHMLAAPDPIANLRHVPV